MVWIVPTPMQQNGLTSLAHFDCPAWRWPRFRAPDILRISRKQFTVGRRVIGNSLLPALVCFLIWLVSCNPCSDTPRSKATSPDGQLVANFYERDCGATTDFSSDVNVQRSSDKFRADEGVVFIAKGRYDLSVEWTGPRTLRITCPSCARKNVFHEVVALGDIDVKYSLGP